MKNSQMYNQDDIERLSNLVDEGRKRIRLEKYGNKQSDSTLPDGWKLKVLGTGTQQKIQIFSPDGNSFFCRRSALQHMVKEGFNEEEIEDMRNCLRHENWEEDPLLPKGML